MRFFGKAALFSGRDANNMTAISVGIQRPRRFIKRFARLGVEDAQKSNGNASANARRLEKHAGGSSASMK
jgi:hypothetical protein